MDKRLLIIGVVVLCWFAYREYQSIRSDMRSTQAKIDAVATESALAVKAIRIVVEDVTKALENLTKRFRDTEISTQEKIEQLSMATCKAPEPPPQIVQTPVEETTPEEPVEEPKTDAPKKIARIVMHSGKSCDLCNQWKTHQMPKWVQVGWSVEVVDELYSAKNWPWFEIYDGDLPVVIVDGVLTNDKFEAAKRKSIK